MPVPAFAELCGWLRNTLGLLNTGFPPMAIFVLRSGGTSYFNPINATLGASGSIPPDFRGLPGA
jgi:hypothetical protein